MVFPGRFKPYRWGLGPLKLGLDRARARFEEVLNKHNLNLASLIIFPKEEA